MTGAPVTVYDSYRDVQRRVFPILVFAYADTPARRGWLLTCGASGRSGCDKCGTRGVRVLWDGTPLSTTRFLGFKGPTAALKLCPAPKNPGAQVQLLIVSH